MYYKININGNLIFSDRISKIACLLYKLDKTKNISAQNLHSRIGKEFQCNYKINKIDYIPAVVKIDECNYPEYIRNKELIELCNDIGYIPAELYDIEFPFLLRNVEKAKNNPPTDFYMESGLYENFTKMLVDGDGVYVANTAELIKTNRILGNFICNVDLTQKKLNGRTMNLYLNDYELYDIQILDKFQKEKNGRTKLGFM